MLDLSCHSLLFKFADHLKDDSKLGHGGRLGYTDAISMIDSEKNKWRLRRSSSKLVIDGVVPRKSSQDNGKDDEIAVDTRSRH